MARSDNDWLGVAAFRSAMAGIIPLLTLTPAEPDTFRGRQRRAGVDEVSVVDVEASAHTAMRTVEHIAREPGRMVKLSTMIVGRGVFEQDGRRADVGPGDVVVYDSHRPYSILFEGDVHMRVILFPYSYLDLPPATLARVTAVRFPADEGLGHVVNPFLAQLGASIADLDGPHASRLVRSALDLLVTMLSDQVRRSHPDSGARGDLVTQVRAWVEEHLGDPDLSPATVAAAHHVSTRHLHAMFAQEDLTVAAWIRARRLERIRRDLCDPLLADQTISAIATRYGMPDAAHVSRVFKAEYGVSPSAYRRERVGGSGPAAGSGGGGGGMPELSRASDDRRRRPPDAPSVVRRSSRSPGPTPPGAGAARWPPACPSCGSHPAGCAGAARPGRGGSRGSPSPTGSCRSPGRCRPPSAARAARCARTSPGA